MFSIIMFRNYHKTQSLAVPTFVCKLINIVWPFYWNPFFFQPPMEKRPWKVSSWRTPQVLGESGPPSKGLVCYCCAASESHPPHGSPKQDLSNSSVAITYDFASQGHFLNQHYQKMSYRQSYWSLAYRTPREG